MSKVNVVKRGGSIRTADWLTMTGAEGISSSRRAAVRVTAAALRSAVSEPRFDPGPEGRGGRASKRGGEGPRWSPP
jgi:hypothetical protein